VFSIGHRATLRPFHARRLLVQRNGSGPGSIVEVTPVAAPPRLNGALVVPDAVAALAS
jgi:hypothetical protein